VYLTLGDGGNVEGPARYFVDQVGKMVGFFGERAS
jgi:hypothetical protein